MAALNYDCPQRGRRECPRCRFTTEPLRNVRRLDVNEGYVLDMGNTERDTFVLWALFGWTTAMLHLLWHNIMVPILSGRRGEIRKNRYDRVLKEFPHSQICPNCNYILRLK